MPHGPVNWTVSVLQGAHARRSGHIAAAYGRPKPKVLEIDRHFLGHAGGIRGVRNGLPRKHSARNYCRVKHRDSGSERRELAGARTAQGEGFANFQGTRDLELRLRFVAESRTTRMTPSGKVISSASEPSRETAKTHWNSTFWRKRQLISVPRASRPAGSQPQSRTRQRIGEGH